jgi:hypothetical protein
MVASTPNTLLVPCPALPNPTPPSLLLYALPLLPHQLPAWPFVAGSVFLGAYILIPYMCLWAPKDPPQQLPPPEEELVRCSIRAYCFCLYSVT